MRLDPAAVPSQTVIWFLTLMRPEVEHALPFAASQSKKRCSRFAGWWVLNDCSCSSRISQCGVAAVALSFRETAVVSTFTGFATGVAASCLFGLGAVANSTVRAVAGVAAGVSSGVGSMRGAGASTTMLLFG